MTLPDGEIKATWKAVRGFRKTAARWDEMACEWPDESARYCAEAARLREDSDWHLATLRRATRATGGGANG